MSDVMDDIRDAINAEMMEQWRHGVTTGLTMAITGVGKYLEEVQRGGAQHYPEEKVLSDVIDFITFMKEDFVESRP